MKRILVTLALIFSLGTFAEGKDLPKSVTFEEGNFFAITTSFNQSLLDDFTEKVLNHDSDELFIYFDTPGGSVIALSRMARIMKGSDIKFTCITNFAASAANPPIAFFIAARFAIAAALALCASNSRCALFLSSSANSGEFMINCKLA